ncbi:PKD domain-containing protein [bacterium]|nr:PKD domain-containing protein [bacterium]
MYRGHCRVGLILLLGLLGLNACASTQAHILQAPAVDSLPDIQLLRSARALQEDILSGSQAIQYSANAQLSGSALLLLPGSGLPAWGLYAIDLQGQSLDSLALLLDVGSGSRVWLLAADYEQERWRSFGPFDGDRTIALDEAAFVSPDGSAGFAVLASGDAPVSLSALSVRSQLAGNLPPEASLQTDLPGGNVPLSIHFDASASSDPDGSIIEYAWDWDGDGGYDNFSEAAQLVHTYNAPGVFQVRLRVTDSDFSRAYATAQLNLTQPGNQAPQAELQLTPPDADVPAQVMLDASASSAGGDPQDSIVLYEWDCDGDGAFDAYGANPQLSHAYAQPGLLTLRLRVTDSAGNQAIATEVLNLSSPGNNGPTAQLDPPGASGEVPLSVSFNAGASDPGADPGDSIVLYEWDLDGDGIWEAYSETPAISHTYTSPASVLARVRVSDSAGNQAVSSSTISATQAGNNPPLAVLSSNIASGYAPLSVEFDAGSSTDGGDSGDSIVLYEWDWDGDGAYEAYSAADQLSHTYALAGSYIATLRVTDSAGNQDTDTLAIEVTAANVPPVAVLQASANECEAGNSLSFYAGSSYDSDGSISKYEWDLDGDGSYETDTGTTDNVSQNYNTPGLPFSVGLRIRDNDGYFASDELVISVHGWQRLTLDSTGLVGYYSSLALIGGKPAICYQQANSSDLRYAVSSSATGASLSDWTIVTIDGAVSGGQYCSLREVNGKPAVSYYDGGLGDLKYALSSSASGSSAADWACMTLDSTGGQSTSLCVVAGNPAIAHYDSVSQDLRYRRSTTVDGASVGDWSQSLVVDSAGSVGNHCCLAVVNGTPAISYADSDNGDLKYAFSSSSTGALISDWNSIVVDSTGGGYYSSLVYQNGLPAIAYYNYGTEKLMYCISATAGGQAPGDWTCLVVDGSTTCGSYCSLSLLGGNPLISYWDYANGDLELARSVTQSGANQYDWSQKQRADGDGTTSGPNVGQYSSLEVLDGRPMIAYLDAGNADLKYAVRF